MDAKRWEKVQLIFDKVVDIDVSQREKLLDELCESDDVLKKEVLSLLEADSENLSILEKPASELMNIGQPGSMVGKKIGQYHIISQIGYGGMGEVYLAERDDKQFNQKVALKIIKKGMDSSETVRRFQTERQILAKLVHPNIANLYDGGITDDGLPYFTMEYVEGEPINEFCDNKQLSISRRIELFLQVLDAVQYAHKNFIVHRDLKPANIIVTNDGQLKLLDFGIAKLLSENVIDENQVDMTQTGLRIMTPGYASPEQVKGEPITTSSDVYSLGVLLYELLSGQSPYNIAGKTAGELEQIICHTNPKKPSTAIIKTGDSSKQRDTFPQKLQKMLHGDLDNICLKALEKEQIRRYNSSEQFADDIKRYINGHPVMARPATIIYRTNKFISRHKGAVFAFSFFIIFIISLISFYTMKLADERDKAQFEAEKAKQISQFMISIFEVADPSQSQGETITARQLVDEGVKRLDEELADQPIIKSEMMKELGGVYYSLGLLEKSKELYEKSLILLKEYNSNNLIGIAGVYHNLGDVNYDLGLYKLADTLYNEAYTLKKSVLADNDTLIAIELISLATLSRLENNFKKSQKLYQEALQIQLAVMEKPHLEIAYTMNNLGRLYQNNEMLDTAEIFLKESLSMRREILGDNNFEVVASMGSLASLYYRSKKVEEAEKLYNMALNVLLKLVGEDHHYTGGIMQSLANVETKLKKYDKAEEHYLRSYQILLMNLPEDHVNIAFPLAGLGRLLVLTNRPTEGLVHLKEAYRLRKLSLPEGNWMIAYVTTYIGRGNYLIEEYSLAEEYLQMSYEIFLNHFGKDHSHTQEVIKYLIDLYETTENEEKSTEFKSKLI